MNIVRKSFRVICKENYNDIVYAGISALVVGEFYLASTRINEIKSAPIEWWVCMPLAVVMLARTITLYGVASWIRRWFLYMERDSCNAGENSEPKKGLLEPLGSLLQCPICTGMHSASLLVILYAFFPDMGWTTTIMLAFASLSMILHYAVELFSWSGRLARVLSGLFSPDPNTEGYEVKQNVYEFLKKLNK